MTQSGLFSAAVATLLTVTVQDLKQDPQDTSAFYLENIYKLQFIGSANAPRPSSPAQLPPFSLPIHAIMTNIFLFMSLCLNLFTAIVAILIWQWLTYSLWVIESSRYSPHFRARVQEVMSREYHAPNSPVNWILMATTYLSVCFSCVGVSIYLLYLNETVFGSVIFCGFLCFLAYCYLMCFMNKVLYSFIVYLQINPNSWFIRRPKSHGRRGLMTTL
jgi:Family of unknown function (DUF6535)